MKSNEKYLVQLLQKIKLYKIVTLLINYQGVTLKCIEINLISFGSFKN
jgi:hypothetical protein